jgi:molybdopterin synthase catalytic subunit
MRVSVLLFARYREAAGRPRVEVVVPSGSTLGEIWSQVRAAIPQLRDEAQPLMACNRVYVRPETPIVGDEEIAAFPPVSGG